MVDRNILMSKLAYIENGLSHLEWLQKTPERDFLGNGIFTGAAKYYLQTCIEAMLDIANHIIARQRYRPPENYVDALRILGEHGILPAEQLPVFFRMARFRNRVVHLYHEVDNREVYKILQTGLNDFRTFIQAIVTHFLPSNH
ncbi:DUF86 domain-containing protein [Desulfofundulus thermobenzoicus]|uniref:DUF86 domain-containing protein n=1 Tax=Desulfofundulus thermobenzoicus TaxID=29376 RepID=A0A6N7IRI0_9FIRM|nr:DUF86 domain-containing protein [Desulfofundulus thermobenzoicus]MQL52183.1 DUF86 domain-containing protein [Desulfofundulus thermobenzoicus]HHW45079.1 DUF86 domain-containing protein [Desulfotomaculum sp.]